MFLRRNSKARITDSRESCFVSFFSSLLPDKSLWCHWPEKATGPCNCWLMEASGRAVCLLFMLYTVKELINIAKSRKLFLKPPKQLTKEVLGTGRLGACAGSLMTNLLTSSLLHTHLALIQTFLRRIHFFSISKLFIWLGKMAALSRSLYTCLGNFCSNFCFGHKSKITAVCLWVHWTLRAGWPHHQPEGITNN